MLSRRGFTKNLVNALLEKNLQNFRTNLTANQIFRHFDQTSYYCVCFIFQESARQKSTKFWIQGWLIIRLWCRRYTRSGYCIWDSPEFLGKLFLQKTVKIIHKDFRNTSSTNCHMTILQVNSIERFVKNDIKIYFNSRLFNLSDCLVILCHITYHFS